MPEMNPHPVVVAVSDDQTGAALAWAAAEAARARCGLHLVHVVHLVPQGPEMVLVDATDAERIGRQTLTGALEQLHDLVADDVLVTSDLRLGAVVPSLAEAAADASMIVLEHRDLSRIRRVVTRSVCSGVAAHARVPVVSVPSSWRPGERRGGPTVTVGVDVPERSAEVLGAAADAARSLGAGLHVVHTWSYPAAYDDALLSPTGSGTWEARARAEVRAALDGLGPRLRGVPVTIDARHAPAADALVEASRSADLLVVGRHDPLVPLGSHLGPVARAVLREAACPVLLANPRPTRRWRRRHAAAAVAGSGDSGRAPASGSGAWNRLCD